MSLPFLLPTQFAFRMDGSCVVMQIGDQEYYLDHPTAFRVSASLNHVAHKVKRLMGDQNTYRNILATLTDANADEREQQAFRDGTAAFAPPPGMSKLTDGNAT